MVEDNINLPVEYALVIRDFLMRENNMNFDNLTHAAYNKRWDIIARACRIAEEADPTFTDRFFKYLEEHSN